MPRTFVALLAGTLFGLGLAISGMMNPAKVVGFLDVAGDWDPTLAFVIGGALLITIPAFRLILADGFALPAKSALDARLIGGAALFGVGWGLSGFCPGGGGTGYGAHAGVRVRRGDDGGNGPLRMGLRASGPQRREGTTDES